MGMSNDSISGRKILLTGAGGSIGSALASSILGSDPRLLILLDHSERSLYELSAHLNDLESRTERLSILGDISDKELLIEIFERHQPEVILHTAALKHVPLMEENPIAAVQINALGTNTLARTAAAFGLGKFIMVSTDKAVNPRSIMGASKRVAELALLRWSSERSRMRSIRLGNVLGSQGSVVPIFERQVAVGGPVTVTHPEASRYFLTMEDAVELILAALKIEGEEGVLYPDLGEPMKIIDLAHKVIKEAGFHPESEIPITLIGLRPGDKMSESFVAARESVTHTTDAKLFGIKTPEIFPDEFDSRMEELAENVNRRDLPLILSSLCKIVPEYQPSESLLRLVGGSSAIQI
jgi:FlaA1/EpsC-like NDP-sugar epimerase